MAIYYTKYSKNMDWESLGFGDPTPGDPEQILAMAREFRSTAEALEQAKTNLESIKNDQDASSQAVTEFKSMSGDTGDSVYRAHGRYATVAGALETYASALESLQARAVTEYNTLAQNQEDQQRNQAAQQALTPEQDPDGSTGRAQAREDSRLQFARQSSQTAIFSLRTDWNDAGRTAANAIDGSFDDGLTPDPWEKFWQMASEILDTLSTVLSIAALVLSWVPFLGQALAVLALVVSALNLVTKLVLAIGYGGDWGAVAWAAVGILGGAFAKGASGLLKGGATALRGTKLTRPLARAAKHLAPRTRAIAKIEDGGRKAAASGKYAAGEYAAAVSQPGKLLKEGFSKYLSDFKTVAKDVKDDGFWRTAANNVDHGRGFLPGPLKDFANYRKLANDPAAFEQIVKYATTTGQVAHTGNFAVQTVLWYRSTTGMLTNSETLGSAPARVGAEWQAMVSDFQEQGYNRD